MDLVNRDSLQSHSLVVMAEREKLPQEGDARRWRTRSAVPVLVGLKPGQRDLTTFVADQAAGTGCSAGCRPTPSGANGSGSRWIGMPLYRP